jgi:hypothetical protein
MSRACEGYDSRNGKSGTLSLSRAQNHNLEAVVFEKAME